MNKHKSLRASKVKNGKDAARSKYRNMDMEKRNKKVRQERHKKRLAVLDARRKANPDYILPSKAKRNAKRARTTKKAVVA